MDVLPAELLIHIMDFLPIKSLFLVMSVSGKWEAAAMTAIRSRKQLSVGSMPADASPGYYTDLSVIDTVDSHMREMMWRSLNKQLVGLQVLLVDDVWCRAEDRETGIQPLIHRHADTLRHLSADMDLTVPSDGRTFPLLESVRCHMLAAGMRDACPVLTTIKETIDDEGGDDWGSSISGGHYDRDGCMLDGIYNDEEDRDWDDEYDDFVDPEDDDFLG